MIALLKTLQVILALSVLIIFHEFGHYFWARVFGIRVEKFFLFFDVGGFKLFSFKVGETEYGMGWLPLGGYCKIAGMVDESLDTEQLKHAPEPWEFRSKPAWQRLLVMSGGVLNNFILAIGLFVAILAIWGKNYIPNDNPVYVNELGYDMGFRTGDRILLYDDYAPQEFMDLQSDLARRRVRKATVLRGADTLDIYIDQALIGDVLNTPGMFDIALPFYVDSVMASSPNSALLKGDRIVGVSGEDTPYLQDAQKVLRAHPGEALQVTVLRGGESLDVPVQVDSLGMLGVFFVNTYLKHREYTVLEAVPAGWSWAWESVTGYLRWNWHQFLYILALLSIMLGVMNLLPIPALDGGHIVFCLYEMITGRKPSDKFLLVAQWIGMILLLLLMFVAFGNDIMRLIR